MNGKTILALTTTCMIAVAVAISFLLTNRLPSLPHLWKLGIIGSILKYLLSFIGVLLTYLFGKSCIESSHPLNTWQAELKHYIIGVCCCGVIALVSAFYLGTHTDDDDPVFGDGEIVVDYEPTDDQRVRHGLILFFGISIPFVYGMHHGFVEYRRKEGKHPRGSSA